MSPCPQCGRLTRWAGFTYHYTATGELMALEVVFHCAPCGVEWEARREYAPETRHG